MTRPDIMRRFCAMAPSGVASVFIPFVLVLALAFALGTLSPATAQEAAAANDEAPAAETDTPDALSTLIDALKDDEARAALIAELEAAAGATGEVESAEPAPVASLGTRIANTTRAAAEGTASALASLPTTYRSAITLLRTLDGETWAAIGAAALDLLFVFVVTVGAFLVLRRLTVPLLRRLGVATRGAGVVRGAATVAGSVVIRLATVLLAWALGYGVMTLFVGEFGEIGLNQTLFLNAFLVVELAKVVVRTLVSPAADDLRALPMDDAAARRLTRFASVVMSILGYGLLLLTPIMQQTVGLLPARAVTVLVVDVALVYAAIVVLWRARAVGDWLVATLLAPPPPVVEDPEGEATVADQTGADETGADQTGADEGSRDTQTPASTPLAPRREGVLAGLLRHWHWAALAWLALIFVRAFTHSVGDLGDIVSVTLQIAAAAFVGVVVMSFLGRRMREGVSLPEDINEKLPALEGRLNRVVPRVLLGLRALVALVVGFFALDRIGLTDVAGWLETDAGLGMSGTLASVAAILLVAWGLWLAVSSWIDYRLNPEYGVPPSSREITLLSLLKNAVTIAIVIFAVMFTLSEIGLNIGPLIASAGVLGLAIGFGAQKLVQDIITGVFIQFENAINVGDVVTVGGTTGAVEKLTIRSVSLRDLHGIFHIVPFSSVDMVSNYTREFSYYVVDMGIAYRENIAEAKQAMFDAFDQLRADPDQGVFVLGDLEYFGLDSFGDNAVVLRARVKTWPGKQWGVGRTYNGYLKTLFDERGIEIPFPHRTIFFGEAKDGTVQTLPIHTLTDDS